MSNDKNVKNSVQFGFKKFAYQIADGKSKPVLVEGGVKFYTENSTSEVTFEADDNPTYYADTKIEKVTGELEMANLPDSFLIDVLGYIRLSNGAIAPVDGAKKKVVHMFTQGNEASNEETKGVRRAYLNCSFGEIAKDEQETGKNIKTKVIPFTVLGKTLPTGELIRKFRLLEGDPGYETLYTEGITDSLAKATSV